VINEPTVSTFILRRDRERGWLTALVWHPRLGCWLPAGGHVEPDETPAQAGIREVMEETGLDVTLVPRPAPGRVPPPGCSRALAGRRGTRLPGPAHRRASSARRPRLRRYRRQPAPRETAGT
jgi:8-oxo-dGTP pyrophosphatase MutT (NUDIX family)